jgi:hypothetical protein
LFWAAITWKEVVKVVRRIVIVAVVVAVAVAGVFAWRRQKAENDFRRCLDESSLGRILAAEGPLGQKLANALVRVEMDARRKEGFYRGRGVFRRLDLLDGKLVEVEYCDPAWGALVAVGDPYGGIAMLWQVLSQTDVGRIFTQRDLRRPQTAAALLGYYLRDLNEEEMARVARLAYSAGYTRDCLRHKYFGRPYYGPDEKLDRRVVGGAINGTQWWANLQMGDYEFAHRIRNWLLSSDVCGE